MPNRIGKTQAPFSIARKVLKWHFGWEKADEIRETVRRSVSSYVPAKSLNLKHIIELISELAVEIEEIEA